VRRDFPDPQRHKRRLLPGGALFENSEAGRHRAVDLDEIEKRLRRLEGAEAAAESWPTAPSPPPAPVPWKEPGAGTERTADGEPDEPRPPDAAA
jgi:hypothetical protein